MSTPDPHLIRMIVAGSRSFKDTQLFKEVMNGVLTGLTAAGFKKGDIEFVSGMAKEGPDRMIVDYAKEHDFPLQEFPAKWDVYGNSAGMVRNGDMGSYGTHCLVFWDGKSKGSANMLDVAKKKNLATQVVMFDPDIQNSLPFIPAFAAVLVKDGKKIGGMNILRDHARILSEALRCATFPEHLQTFTREQLDKALKYFRTYDPFAYASTKDQDLLNFMHFIENPNVTVTALRLPIITTEPSTQMSKRV